MKKIVLTWLTLVIPALSIAQTANPQPTDPIHHDYKGTGTAPAISPIYNWTGIYVGGNIGALWGDLSEHFTTASFTGAGTVFGASPLPFNAGDSSFTGGVELGYNYQVTPVVYGLEADFNGVGLASTMTVGQGIVSNIYIPGDHFYTRSRWESSVRARIAYAIDNWLFYFTGGVAFENLNIQSHFIETSSNGVTFPLSDGSATKTLIGGTFGVGGEFAFTDNCSVALEYRYADYGTKTFNLGNVAAFANQGPVFVYAPVSATAHVHTNETLFKINYNFG